jgi:hypothetical protein
MVEVTNCGPSQPIVVENFRSVIRPRMLRGGFVKGAVTVHPAMTLKMAISTALTGTGGQ